MLNKKRGGQRVGGSHLLQHVGTSGGGLSRRLFLAHSGLAAGGLAGISALDLRLVRRAEAKTVFQEGEIERRKTVCPFCAVGCSIWAEVQNGVWIGQEPVFESPVNMGTHCAKGAAARELVIGERRLKYPTKLEGGRWQRVSWEQAIDEIGDRLLQIREQAGPDAVYWLGSAKFSNEQAYLCRKFAAFWGSNNVDHQARICHSTTVAGVANTFGYGAMTNSFNDIHNSKSIFLIGGNPAEAHPVSMLHLLRAKENGAKLMVIDPRFTRTAAHAHEYVRLRAGTDVAFMWGVLWHIFENGWQDQEFIDQRVFAMDAVEREVAKYPPDEVERITGVTPDQVLRVARTMAENRPGTVIWCMGLTQSTIGNSNTRAASILQLALGNMGKSGGGTNIFRGHDNVQGATDLGLLCHDLPSYYGLEEGAWKHWARVWDVDYEWLKGRFASKELMETKGIPVSRWFDGVLEAKDNLDQPHNVGAMVFWGHAPNSQTRMPDLKRGLEAVDLLVIIDPHPTLSAVLAERSEGVYLLPAGSTMEMAGSVTNSQRALQWREKVVDPVFEAKSDYEITHLLATKLGFAEPLFKHIAVANGEPVAEDITREFNRGAWVIGYTGQSPERMKLHMEHQDKFDSTTLLGMSGPVKGEYYGLPWPCWGDAEMRHPGTPILWDPSKPVAEGGIPFRARWGVEHGVGDYGQDGEVRNLLAEETAPVGAELEGGYPEFTMAMLKKLGWDQDLTAQERQVIQGINGDETNWKTDLSGGIQRVAILHGCAPFGNGKARALVWNFPDPVPIHREPLYTPRRDLAAEYRTYDDRQDYRLPTLYWTIQKEDFADRFPLILISGRLVEYEGGGDETRSNKWLAEFQQQMFAEVNPGDAAAAGIEPGAMMWLHSPEG
ncbi:MAG TPA: molybdopterin-dependent oxidoreductase, partial [Geminicoccaceae bacterium]